ncbi:YhcU family protein [Metabacillus sp. GX 13764]|uniref:DUF5365 family protein n=1 Tax=Metabacillus kandeliae TaxID=2900151 RepID=UPI001E5BE786|nr:DUF5365 family protein [Metabacillus kandeliae]MCD7035192.1 YhcU family protein [Metabacillus kandeliae]
MKIVTASTEEQEKHIEELIGKIYEDIFPLHFSNDDIEEFKELSILLPEESKQYYNGTIEEAFQIISSLQTLVALLESPNCQIESKYQDMYYRNIRILNEYGFAFPLSFEQFLTRRNQPGTLGKAANDWMI